MRSKFPIFLNKYFIAFAFFVVWVIFFDDTNYITQLSRLSDLRALQQKETFYKGEIAKAKQELDDIKNSSESAEKFAREKYFMKKNGEDIFIIENSQQ